MSQKIAPVVRRQTIADALRRIALDELLRARVHPYQRMVKRRAGRAIPQETCLALVCHADGGKIAGGAGPVAFDQFGRRRTNAGVNHVEAGVAGAHGDLFGAIGMAIETRLADKEFGALSELLRHASDFAAHRVELAAGLRGKRRGKDQAGKQDGQAHGLQPNAPESLVEGQSRLGRSQRSAVARSTPRRAA